MLFKRARVVLRERDLTPMGGKCATLTRRVGFAVKARRSSERPWAVRSPDPQFAGTPDMISALAQSDSPITLVAEITSVPQT